MQFVGGNFFDIGPGVLPFSITPYGTTSSAGHTMLKSDQVWIDDFDLNGDPETSAITPGDVPMLRNTQGYIPHLKRCCLPRKTGTKYGEN
jgi:hypothetical protein